MAGRLVAEGTPGSLGGRREANATVSFRYTEDLAPLPPDATPEGSPPEVGELVSISTDRPTATVAALARWASAAGRTELAELAVTRRSLEHTYLALVAEHGPSEPAEEAR